MKTRARLLSLIWMPALALALPVPVLHAAPAQDSEQPPARVPAQEAPAQNRAAQNRPAQNRPARSGEAPGAPLPFCRLDPHDPEKLAVEPCRKAPSQPRRSVAQVVQRMPAPGRALVYGPPAPPPPGASHSTTMAPSPLLNGCDPGGCRDVNGQRYNGQVGAPPATAVVPGAAASNGGAVLLDSRGHPCARNGLLIQCF